jgi:transglutaminase/protease-like cytokinesis protein 3
MKHLFLAAFVSLAIGASAQKVSNKIAFAKGQKLEISTTGNTVITQEVMGQSMEIKMDVSMVRGVNVSDVANGTATLNHEIKSMKFSSEAMGQAQSFDSNNPDDLKSDMGKNVKKSLDKKYTITVDAQGKVVAVKEDGDAAKKASDDDAAGGQMAQMMGSMGAGFQAPKAGDATEFAILPAKEVGKGDSWTDSLNKAKGVKGAITYTVKDITDIDVVLDYVQNTTMETTQQMMGMEATINTKDKTTGTITIDRKTGLMKQKTANSNSEGTVDVQGMSIPVSTKGTATTTVKSL